MANEQAPFLLLWNCNAVNNLYDVISEEIETHEETPEYQTYPTNFIKQYSTPLISSKKKIGISAWNARN